MVIKRAEKGEKTPDIPVFRGPGPSGGNRGPDIPVYIDIPIVTPGGGRADAPNIGTGGSSVVDIWNRGNNPYQVSERHRRAILDLIERERIVAAQQAAQVAAEQAAQVRMVPDCLATCI